MDWAELAREVVERFGATLSTAGIEVRFEGLERAPVRADRFRLEQVLTNLITNAVRYAPRAPVVIRLERIAGSGENQGGTRLVFSDRGPGIAAENQERVFQRFERLISAVEISGMGLGLYIVREIMRAHGGTIRVEAEPGGGARFVAELPGPGSA
jgi:signal transduction histidine kinase